MTRALDIVNSPPAPLENLSIFQKKIQTLCGAFSIEPSETAEAKGSIQGLAAEHLNIVTIRQSSGVIFRSASNVRTDGRDHFYLIIQQKGHCLVETNGTQTRLNLCDLMLSDAAHPTRMGLTGQMNRQTIIHLPRTYLTGRVGPQLSGGVCIKRDDPVPFDYTMLIDGASTASASTFPVKNPSTGAVVGHTPQASISDLDANVAAANAAFPAWAALSEAARQKALLDIADVLEANAEELAELLTAEQGKPLVAGIGSRWELEKMIGWARFTSKLYLPVETIQDDAAGKVELHRKPMGVVGSITPWNFPQLIAMWHVAPAPLSGNTVVIKPSPNTPLSTLTARAIQRQRPSCAPPWHVAI